MSDQNLFLDFLARDKAMRNQDTALTPGRVNARVGVTTQPVAQTDFGALARRYGVPPAVVENDPDTWRQRAASDDAQRQIDLAPKLGQWLGGDPQRAKMTHDSLDAMAGVEHAISAVFPKNGTDADKLRYWKEHNPGQGSITTPPTTAQVVVAKIRKAMDSLYSGTQNSDVGLYGIAANAMGNLFGDNSAIAQHLRQRASEKQREAQKYSQANKGGEWEQAIYGGIESLPQALVALGAGVASGGSGSVVVGTTGSLLTAGATVQGQSYITARQAGLSHEEAQAFGQRDAAVEVATELLPTARIFHALKVGTPAMDRLKDWAIATIEEQVGEQFATHLQDLNQWASIDANKGKTLDQYFAERPDAAFRTAVATAIMSGTVGGIIGATNLAQRRRAPAEQQAQKSQRTEALLTGLKELAEAAPIAKRDVSTFESWVRSAAEGTQATDVYIDARTLVETLQQSGLTEPEIVAALPSIRTELPTALLANGDVRIPIEEFAARSGELGQSLIPHLRLDPNDMSTSEAQTFMQSAQDEFQKETEKAFAEINADDQFRQSTERVADTVYEKLNQAGRFTPDTNRAYASLHAAFFARLASDLGTTPEEAAARYPLLIQSEGVGEGPGVMDQPFKEGQLLHGTTRDAAKQIAERGVEPRIGDFIRQFYDIEADDPGAFFAHPENIKGAVAAMRAGVARKLSKSQYEVTINDIREHGAIAVATPDPDTTFQLNEDGTSTALAGWGTFDEPPIGAEPGDFYSRDTQRVHALIEGDALVSLVEEHFTPREGYDQSGQPLPATIEVDGKQRSTVNSNGQPLAATEEGVRAFWDWFGDSKVVDEQGRPLVVYHGTAADFDIFKNSPSTRHGHGRQMPGIYLTPDPSIAEAYARTAANARDASTEINGAAILPLFVKMENPARFADPEDFANANVVEIKKHGYDGAVRFAPNDGRLLEIVVFDPTQIKSIHNRGTFDPNDPRILYQNGQPIFYSALQRTVESSKQAKAPASQWKSILQNAPGVKAEELEWSGILDLFDEDPKRVWTRDELVQLLDAGGIKVDEVVLGDEGWIEQRAQELYDEAEREALNDASEYVDTSHFSEEVEDENGNTVWQVYGPYADEDSVFDTEEAAEEAVTEYNDREREDALEYFKFDRSFGEFKRMARDEQDVQFKDWSSDPSNDTYRELLITLPIGEGRNPDRAPSTHWDQPNVVAHARFMDKRDASGDRVLFIEEVQSDWHQKGRDQGYAGRLSDAEVARLRDVAVRASERVDAARAAVYSHFEESTGVPPVGGTYYAQVRDAAQALGADHSLVRELRSAELAEREAGVALMPSGIPNAPFKSTWPALVMKRMIRWAVDNGYTKIAWTTGAEQTERYDLGQATGALDHKGRDGDAYLVEMNALAAGTLAENGMGEQTNDYGGGRMTLRMTENQMREAFGNDVSARFMALPEGAALPEYDLKIGGEGMKAFYDRNLVNITNDLIKKYGAKVGKVTLPNPEKVKQWNRTPQPDTPETLAARAAYEADRTNMDAARAYQDALMARNDAAFAAANENGALSDVKHGFEINDKLAEAAAGGFPLFQGPRGQIRVGDVTQDPTVITLLQRADLSTFLHESGHFFLEVLMHVAAQPDAPQRVVDDMNAFLKWTGVESMGQWSKMTTNEKREHHERFARGFEAFLYEGNAPSLELKSLFQRFRDWLLTVYRSLTQLNVELNPEVRGIFSRMLASDQAIREAEQQVGYEPILTEKPVGMDDAEWEAYQRLGADATSEAVTDLERRSLRDMRYAGKAAGRELKRLQREIRTMRDTMRAEVEADLAREPVYRAQEFMKKGLLDGEPVEGPTKMLISEVEALYEDRPKLYVNEVKRALGFGQYGMLAKDGIHPEQIAELFGFTSADHMIQDLMLAEPFKKAVETEIDTRMLERYGDITSEKALQDAVDQAIHNDVRGRFVATEFAALSKAPGKPRVMAAAARSLAEKAVSRLKVRNLRPAQYEAAERRAAKAAAEASAKGDIALAASEKRNQLINFYGAKASHDALADVDKMVRYFKKFETKGTRQNLDPGYLDQIDKLLERFDLRKSVTNRQADKRKSLKAWVDRQKEMGFDPLIDEELLDEANRVPYREMTVEEMRGLRDTIRNIEHLARLKKKLLLAKDQREFADAVNDVAGAIRANAYKNVTEIIGAKTWWERVQSGVHDFFAMHRKMANWAHVMDGNKMGGPVWERFIRPMNERGAWEASAKAKATADLGALFDRLKGQNLNKRSFIPAIGKSLSLQDRLMVALNTGNEGNLQRLMDGERWEQDRLNAVLEPLTQEHWAFVQAVWDYLDSFYPEVAAKEVRVSGVAPQKVEAVPFERQLADGSTVQLRGGYFPIKYDPARSSRAEADTAAEVLQQMTQGRYTAAQTRRGHTKARAEQVDRPVRKDFGVIFEHVNQVIHDLAWHEYLIDANRLLRAVDIDTAIREAHGPETLRWMRKALEDIALGDIPAQSSFEQVINHVRAGASVAAMGWNLWTSMIQPLGLTQSASRIGTRWVVKGMGRIMGDAAHMESAARWVYERSEFMRNRGATQQREIAEIRSKVSDKSPLRKTVELAVPAPVVDAVTDSFFILIAKAQLIADLPTWIGQYEKSLAAGETEERAAALADQAVLDSQGGGQIKDMAGIQRGGALMKLWTNFYGYFNTTYNLMADRTAQLRREGVRDLPAFAVDQLILSALPSILTTLLYQFVKGDDDDWEDLPKHMAEDFFGYMTGLMVGLREIGAVLNPNSSYQGPAGARVFSEINKFGKQVQQGEGDEALARSANQLAGILFHYPATQIDRTARGIAALEQGEAGPLAPVVGPPVER